MLRSRVLFLIEIIVLVLFIYSGLRFVSFLQSSTTWGDSLFERTSGGDYFLVDSDFIEDAYVTQKYEGTIKDITIAFENNIQVTVLNLESVRNPGTNLTLKLSPDIVINDKAIGIFNAESQTVDIDQTNDLNALLDNLSKGDFVSVQIASKMELGNEALALLNFTLIPRI